MRTFTISGLALLVTAAAVACGSQNTTNDTGGNGNGTSSSNGSTSGGGSSSAAASSMPTQTPPPGSSASSSSATSSAASSSSTSGSSDAGSSDAASGPTSSLPALHVQGAQILDANGKTVVLEGVAIPDIGLLYSEGNGIAGVTGRIDEVLNDAQLAIHAIRLPVYPRTVVNSGSPTYSPLPYPVGPAGPDGGFGAVAVTNLSASDYIAQVLQPSVDYATSKNLYAIVDYHQIDNVTTGTSSADAVTFWTTVAPVFASYSNVIYEAFNEPIDSGADAGVTSAGAWTSSFTAAAQSWITAIRGGAPNNLIIVGSPSWSQYPDGAIAAGLTGGNLAFTAHAYPSNWPGTMNAFQDRVAKAAMSEPVAMTEWGYQIGTASPFGGGSLNTPNDTWAQSLQSFDQSNGVSWTAWIADQSWQPTMFKAPATGMSINTFAGLTDFGTFVQNWLNGGTAPSDGGSEQ